MIDLDYAVAAIQFQMASQVICRVKSQSSILLESRGFCCCLSLPSQGYFVLGKKGVMFRKRGLNKLAERLRASPRGRVASKLEKAGTLVLQGAIDHDHGSDCEVEGADLIFGWWDFGASIVSPGEVLLF